MPFKSTARNAFSSPFSSSFTNCFFVDPYLLNYNFLNGFPAALTHTRASNATYINYSGSVATASSNVPRITHDKDGNALGYLHEPQGTNLQTVSTPSRSGSPWWGETNITFTPNASVSPSGATDASAVVATVTSTTLHYMTRGYTAPSADTVMTMSLYAKAGAVNFLRLALDSSSRAKSVFNLTDGSIVSTGSNHVSSYAEDVGNGWWRCVLVGETSGSGNFIAYAHDDLNGTTAWAGDGSATSISVWGAQVEEGTAATSLIPTTGAQATRQADAVSGTIAIPAGEWSMVMDTTPLAAVATLEYFLHMAGPSAGPTLDLLRIQSASFRLGESSSGSNIDVQVGVDVTLSPHSYGLSIDESGNYSIAVDGVALKTDTSSTMGEAPPLTSFELSASSYLTPQIVERFRMFRNYKTAAELITLTT